MTPGANVHEASGDMRVNCRSRALFRAEVPASLGAMIRAVLEDLVALVAPPTCAACRSGLVRAERVLCGGCRRSLPWLAGERCPRCGLPGRCRRCPARAAAFDRAWAPLAHEGPARALVAALKFHGALPVAGLMAAQIAAGAPPGLLSGVALVPVPLHPARRRTRGLDQAARLARALGARTGCRVVECLRRSGPATRQLGADRTTRLDSRRLAIRAVGRSPPHVVLVDDVHTTGASLDACARALREAGAERVAAVTYARALGR